jgi:predicted acyl esterase
MARVWHSKRVTKLLGESMEKNNPDVLAGSSNLYQNWEVVDPEKWVPDGYVCIRIDSRGAGRSPGFMDHNNARETKEIHYV